MREFVSEPGRQSTRIRTSNSNPGHVSIDTEKFSVLGELNEPSQVTKSLLSSQVLKVSSRVRFIRVSERLRLTIESVFK